MFIDEIKVCARAGHGGKGCVAFHREAFITKGGPSGGNGGRGGNVFLQADHDLNNLIAQYYQPRLIAEDGEGGMGKGMDGHAGKDVLVKVPCGTLVWKLTSEPEPLKHRPGTSKEIEEPASLAVSSGQRPLIRHAGRDRGMEIDLGAESEDKPSTGRTRNDRGTTGEPLTAPGSASKGELVADLTQHGQQIVLCKGGRGGLGNRNFATAARQTPRFAQPGEPGEEGQFLLELRIMAEVGLVGYPNAGKSTLLTAISKARPKVAPYPFTTLHPQIGIVEYPDFYRLTVCDVPGLIEGAHQNVGLGHEFLRHIQRCKFLVLLLDMAGVDARQPWDDYQQLLNELRLYNPSLLEKPRLVVANKMDEPAALENLKKFKRKIRATPVLPMAAAFDEGIEKFRKTIRTAVEKAGTRRTE